MRALITGASAGIGRAFALSLAEQGYSVTAVARGIADLDQLMSELGAGHDYLVADLATTEGLRATAALLRSGVYSLLVNIGGTATHGDFAELSLESALTVMDLNCRAVVVLAHAFLDHAVAGQRAGERLLHARLHPKPGIERLQRLEGLRHHVLRNTVARTEILRRACPGIVPWRHRLPNQR